MKLNMIHEVIQGAYIITILLDNQIIEKAEFENYTQGLIYSNGWGMGFRKAEEILKQKMINREKIE